MKSPLCGEEGVVEEEREVVGLQRMKTSLWVERTPLCGEEGVVEEGEVVSLRPRQSPGLWPLSCTQCPAAR